jgi:hypothetical protein
MDPKPAMLLARLKIAVAPNHHSVRKTASEDGLQVGRGRTVKPDRLPRAGNQHCEAPTTPVRASRECEVAGELWGVSASRTDLQSERLARRY